MTPKRAHCCGSRRGASPSAPRERSDEREPDDGDPGPRGSGKSARVAEWLEREQAGSCPGLGDGDPRSDRAGVRARASRALAAATIDGPTEPADGALGLDDLDAALYAAPPGRPFVLVIDDAHHVTDPRVLEGLVTLVARHRHFYLYVVGRGPDPIEGLGAGSFGIATLDGAAFRFGVDEVLGLARRLEVPLDRAGATRLQREVGGWAAPIRLALVMADDPEGRRRAVEEYFGAVALPAVEDQTLVPTLMQLSLAPRVELPDLRRPHRPRRPRPAGRGPRGDRPGGAGGGGRVGLAVHALDARPGAPAALRRPRPRGLGGLPRPARPVVPGPFRPGRPCPPGPRAHRGRRRLGPHGPHLVGPRRVHGPAAPGRAASGAPGGPARPARPAAVHGGGPSDARRGRRRARGGTSSDLPGLWRRQRADHRGGPRPTGLGGPAVGGDGRGGGLAGRRATRGLGRPGQSNPPPGHRPGHLGGGGQRPLRLVPPPARPDTPAARGARRRRPRLRDRLGVRHRLDGGRHRLVGRRRPGAGAGDGRRRGPGAAVGRAPSVPRGIRCPGRLSAGSRGDPGRGIRVALPTRARGVPIGPAGAG